jgi:hypothetical protein
MCVNSVINSVNSYHASVQVIADDMIIAAATKEEHDHILQQVMGRALPLNMKFYADKMQYMVSEVHGTHQRRQLQGDSSRTHAPTRRQSLLGMTRFLTQYIQDEATLTAPLRMLLREDMAWQWHTEQQAALESVNRYYSSDIKLKVIVLQSTLSSLFYSAT